MLPPRPSPCSRTLTPLCIHWPTGVQRRMSCAMQKLEQVHLAARRRRRRRRRKRRKVSTAAFMWYQMHGPGLKCPSSCISIFSIKPVFLHVLQSWETNTTKQAF